MSSAEPRSGFPGAAWSRAEPPHVPPHRSAVERFLGGSPGAVLIRLIVLSFLVGALLMWLDVRPQDLLLALDRFVRRLWDLGFDAIRQIAEYIAAGALIVIPAWLVIRLLNLRSLR